MTCPKCHADFAPGRGECPECGVRLLRNVSGVMKTSTVFIAAGDDHGVYRSVQDVPEPLRARLLEVTASSNSGTIVIADQAGREQITLEMARRDEMEDAVAGPGGRRLSLDWRVVPWIAAFLLLAAAAVIGATFLSR